MATPVWFITGASSGFGLEMAKSALQRGHIVVACARSTDRLQSLAALGADTLAFDVTSPIESIEATAKSVFEKHGRIDYLINAAGYILDGAVEELSPEETYACFNTNVFGVMNTVKSFLPHIRAQPIGINGKRATIATFGSLGSWNGGASFSVYAMTKASCSSLAESLRKELQPFEIVVTVIEPGYFRTSFLNPGARINSKVRMSEYEDLSTPTGQVRKALDQVNNNQPGDPVKGAILTVDILTQSGVATGKGVPVRVVLGADCDACIRTKIRETTTILEEWKDEIFSTDHVN